MVETPCVKQKSFAIGFRDLSIWSVAAQFAVHWNWSEELIIPLGAVLERRSEFALDALTPDMVVTLLTIRFDGSIEPRNPIHIKDIKGKLFRVRANDVVFSKIDVRNGAIGLASDDIKTMCVTSEFPVYSVDAQKVYPEYIKLLFRTSVFKQLLNSMISGTSGRKRIQPSQLEGVKVPIPPLLVQQKIVAFWEKVQHAVTNARIEKSCLIEELNKYLIRQTHKYKLLRNSKLFSASFAQAPQWDVKAGRAAVFKEANPTFIRLGEYTEECADMVKPWVFPEKKWPIYGVNNKDGVFLSTKQETKYFNAAYKKIEKGWFFHNPTRANVGSLGIVPEVPEDAITSPEYQVWKITGGFDPEFMDLLLQTEYFLTLVSFNRVGGVKQRMYYANLAEIRLPMIAQDVQQRFVVQKAEIERKLSTLNEKLVDCKNQIEKLILGTLSVEDL